MLKGRQTIKEPYAQGELPFMGCQIVSLVPRVITRSNATW